MVAVILAEPENAGNVGSVCRAMANFGFDELILINPKCDYKSADARNRAKHSQEILSKAKTADWSVLENYSLVAATAGIITTDYNLPRTPLTPEQGAEKILSVKSAKGKGAAILFGRESTGLTNGELARADFVITIPTTKKYASMNLSHSVAVMLYEIAKKNPENTFTLLPRNEKEVLLKKIFSKIDSLPFRTETQKETQKKLWKNIIGRSLLTRREAFALFGFFSALEKQRRNSPTAAKEQPVRRRPR